MTQNIFDALAKKALTDAAELVLQGHYKGSYAADAEGKQVMPNHSRAVCFCAVGAVYRAALDLDRKHPLKLRISVERTAIERLRDALPVLGLGPSIPVWNDRPDTTPAAVAGALVFASLGDQP